VLSADMDRTDKVVMLIDDCRSLGLTILPPDVNSSVHAFTVADERTIRYGLGAIKGVGEGAVDELAAERERNGPYPSLEEFCRRVDLNKINRRALEALIRSGSLDQLGANRATLMERLTDALAAGEQAAHSHKAGQNDFFAAPGAPAATATRAGPGVPEWNESQRLRGERETLGLYLTGHPIASFESQFKVFASGRIAEFLDERPQPAPEGGRNWHDARVVTLAGLVFEVRKRGPRTSVVLDDRSGRIEVSLYEEVYQKHREVLVSDALVQVEGALRFDDFSNAWRLHARQVQSLDAVRERQARHLILTWPARAAGGDDTRLVTRLKTLLAAWRGGRCGVAVRYEAASAAGTLLFSEDWRVRPCRELLEGLETLFGPQGVRLSYAVVET
jgi:DNA polymerase-3 subunit alpha